MASAFCPRSVRFWWFFETEVLVAAASGVTVVAAYILVVAPRSIAKHGVYFSVILRKCIGNGGVPQNQRRAVGTERLSMEAFWKNERRGTKNLTDSNVLTSTQMGDYPHVYAANMPHNTTRKTTMSRTPSQNMVDEAAMNTKIAQLQEEIRRLKKELADREAALPVHSVRPHQLMAIEELEEKISRKQEVLKSLDTDVGNTPTEVDGD